MNPVHVNCPQCQKPFLVKATELKPGQAQFRCTSCQAVFAFNWPQPPGVQRVVAQVLGPEAFRPAAELPKAQASVNTAEMKSRKPCPQCGVKASIEAKECASCGVVFEKVRRLKPHPVMPPAGAEVKAAWESVRAQFIDEKRHQDFIQICYLRDNLPYASSQYKAILDVDPNNDIAQRMQNRIIQLAAVTYLEAQTKEVNQTGLGPAKMGLVIGAGLVVLGFMLQGAKSLVALGISVWVFIIAMRKLA
ncbi:MAG: zinc-ribbon domain-containing protein [Oligoflexia bacterium]|nr:zinc-ribbon domain-containing protein [Oligoflexia bacterium]